MNIVLNKSCTVLPCTCENATITSALITAYQAALPSPDHTLKLVIGTIEIDLDDLNTVGNEYTLTPEDFSTVDALPDGVYKVDLVKTVTSTGATTTETYCLLVDCVLKCTLVSKIAEDDKINYLALYKALTLANECNECRCDNAVALYECLINKLENTECGC